MHFVVDEILAAAGQVPLVDRVFGTHLKPEGWPETYGCRDDVPPRGYVVHASPDDPAGRAAPGIDVAPCPG